MTKADTSAAAVERLAEQLDAIPGTAFWSACAATLRALLAERDEAIDQRNAADFVLASAIKMSSRRSAERDAARAEVERLREAIKRYVAAHAIDTEATDAEINAAVADLEHIAQEPGHE